MSAVEKSREYGTPGGNGYPSCADWRDEIFSRLPTWAEALAAEFLRIAGGYSNAEYGNAQGNQWLRRTATGIVDPSLKVERFLPIRRDLYQAAENLRTGYRSVAAGMQAASDWLVSIERRLIIGSHNATHDDESLVAYAQTQANAIDKNASILVGSIAKKNRLQRLGIAPPPAAPRTARGNTLSAQYADYQAARLSERNAFTPPSLVTSLRGLVFHYRQPLSVSLINVEAVEYGQARAQLHGINPPDENTPLKHQLARLSCSLWWRRQLRRQSGRAVEQVMREAHKVHKRAGIYCSHQTVETRRAQRLRNNALLETLEAINQDGQTYSLAELAELGLANPDHRRAELMLRIRDTEAEARRLGHVGMFYTMTTPSRFHPVVAQQCRRNRKYDGSTPREAQQHLQAAWAKARAKLARDDIGIYGIRVVEPHHDGTPHWHMLVWMAPEHAEAVTKTLREYAEEESPEETFGKFGKTTARFDAKPIDYNKGTAAGYVAKYISKNINGEQFMDMDQYGEDMKTVAPRIEAWASVWGIRQFQFVGLPSVTVWREVRRLTEKNDKAVEGWEAATRPHECAARRFAQIRKAANAGQWDVFLRLMGGPMVKRADQPMRAWVEIKFDTSKSGQPDAGIDRSTGEYLGAAAVIARGRYGETQSVTHGVVATGRPGRESEYMTRLYKWEVRRKGEHREPEAEGLAVGEAECAWTRVTNCTQIDITPPDLAPAELAEQRERLEEWQKSDFYRADMEDAYREAADAREAAHRLFVSPPPTAAIIEEDEFFPAGI